MFGMPTKFTPEWYNVRNPKAAAIFHRMINPYFNSISMHCTSEDMLRDNNVMENINGAFKDCLKYRSSKSAIDQKMAEMLGRYARMVGMASQDDELVDEPGPSGTAMAIMLTRHVIFGVAPGLAQNADHACAITADILFILSRQYHQEPQNDFLWTVGFNFKKIGLRCDELGYSKMPADMRAKRSIEWWDGYNPAGLAIIAA